MLWRGACEYGDRHMHEVSPYGSANADVETIRERYDR